MPQATLREPKHRREEPAEHDQSAIYQYRNHVLDVNRGIVAGYRVADPLQRVKPLDFPTQLAYLRAQSIINISKLLSAHYREDSQPVIDRFSDEALKFHHWGRDVYWRAIADIQNHGLDLATGENIGMDEIDALCKSRMYSQEKINEIEEKVQNGGLDARFPGLIRTHEKFLDPFELFQGLKRDYNPKRFGNRFLCKVIELAYNSAVDTLALKDCFDGRGYLTFKQESALCDIAKIAHQNRGLSFWEPKHEVDIWAYERACRDGADRDEQARLKGIADISGEKLDKLERRHLGMEGYDMSIKGLASQGSLIYLDIGIGKGNSEPER